LEIRYWILFFFFRHPYSGGLGLYMKNNFVYGQMLLDTVNGLREEKIQKRLVLMRHSVRERDPEKSEADDPISDNGRELARSFGERLYPKCDARIWTSPIGRCVETGARISAGFRETGGNILGSEEIWQLGAFYVKNLKSVSSLLYRTGESIPLIRKWIAGELPTDWMDEAKGVLITMTKALMDILGALEADQMAICVTHDWNVYLLRTLLLDLNLEQQDPVNYLDGFLLYQFADQIYMANNQGSPERLKWQTAREII
jgi:broad specificity phosphatase PhoE